MTTPSSPGKSSLRSVDGVVEVSHSQCRSENMGQESSSLGLLEGQQVDVMNAVIAEFESLKTQLPEAEIVQKLKEKYADAIKANPPVRAGYDSEPAEEGSANQVTSVVEAGGDFLPPVAPVPPNVAPQSVKHVEATKRPSLGDKGGQGSSKSLTASGTESTSRKGSHGHLLRRGSSSTQGGSRRSLKEVQREHQAPGPASTANDSHRDGAQKRASLGTRVRQLSGKPPTQPHEFSNLEAIRPIPSSSASKLEEVASPASTSSAGKTQSGRRRKSYFRTGGFQRGDKAPYVRQSSGESGIRAPPIVKRGSGTKAIIGQRKESHGNASVEAEDHREETVQCDTWDSVREEAVCTLCNMAFSTPSKLERHLGYSLLHVRNVERLHAVSVGLADPAQDWRMLDWQYRLIYSGSKLFWRTSLTVDVNIYLWEADGGTPFVQVLAYDPDRDEELPPVFASFPKIAAQVEHDEEKLRATAAEMVQAISSDTKPMITLETTLQELKRQAIVTLILMRLLEGDSDDGVRKLKLAQLTTDSEVWELDKPPYVRKPEIAYRRRSSRDGIDEKIEEVQQETTRTQELTSKAAEHLEAANDLLKGIQDTVQVQQGVTTVDEHTSL